MSEPHSEAYPFGKTLEQAVETMEADKRYVIDATIDGVPSLHAVGFGEDIQQSIKKLRDEGKRVEVTRVLPVVHGNPRYPITVTIHGTRTSSHATYRTQEFIEAVVKAVKDAGAGKQEIDTLRDTLTGQDGGIDTEELISRASAYVHVNEEVS